MATTVVVLSVIAVVIVVVVVLRQGSVGRLSDEDGRRPPRDQVVERPAGPDAEAMDPDPPGRGSGTRPPDGGTTAWPDEGAQP